MVVAGLLPSVGLTTMTVIAELVTERIVVTVVTVVKVVTVVVVVVVVVVLIVEVVVMLVMIVMIVMVGTVQAAVVPTTTLGSLV